MSIFTLYCISIILIILCCAFLKSCVYYRTYNGYTVKKFTFKIWQIIVLAISSLIPIINFIIACIMCIIIPIWYCEDVHYIEGKYYNVKLSNDDSILCKFFKWLNKEI